MLSINGNGQITSGSFNLISDQTSISGNLLANKLYLEKTSSPTIVDSVLELDLLDSQQFLVDFDNNISAINIVNVPSIANTSLGFSLIFTYDNTGVIKLITWPANIKWSSNITPVLSFNANKIDIFTFITFDNGTNWLGFVGGQNF